MENAEDALARRVQYEREKRGWSYEQLARAMNDAGVRIGASALWKIENQQPRRTISLDEAVGFAEVFGQDLRSVLVPPEFAHDTDVYAFLEQYERDFKEASDATLRCAKTALALDDLLRRHPQTRKFLVPFLGRAFPDGDVAEAREFLLGDRAAELPTEARWWAAFQVLDAGRESRVRRTSAVQRRLEEQSEQHQETR